MASLVPDYGSDSESSFDSDSADDSTNKVESVVLPKPDFKTGSSDGHSVFINPFTAADNAKIAILEKHVKMISTDVKTVNGKKICWNYRKNKCRFGQNCKYAHDSDVQIDPTKRKSEIVNKDLKVRQVGTETKKQQTQFNKSRKRENCDNIIVSNKTMKTS